MAKLGDDRALRIVASLASMPSSERSGERAPSAPITSFACSVRSSSSVTVAPPRVPVSTAASAASIPITPAKPSARSSPDIRLSFSMIQASASTQAS